MGAFGRQMEASIAKVVGDVELTGNAPVLLLCELAVDGPLRPKQLQALAGLTSGGMTKQLDRFEELGLIRRAHGRVTGDRRAILVSLTPRGKDLADRLGSVVDQHVDDMRRFLAQLATLLDEPG
jgi:DNA-binding MarR family transcriptional regulator